MERFFNGLSVTLSSNILDTDNPAIFNITSDALPLDPNYVILIGSEYLRVTNVNTSGSPYVYTADRGVEATTPDNHNSGDSVVHILTAGSNALILAEQNQYVDTASINTTDHRIGRVQNTDQKTLVDGGAAFDDWFVDRFRVVPPDTGAFTLRNTDDLTQNSINGIYKIRRVAPSSVGYTLITIPVATSSFTIGFQFATSFVSGQAPSVGIGVFDSGSNKHVLALHGIQNTAPNVYFKIERWNSFSTINNTPQSPIAAYPANMFFMKVEIDGTNINFFYSYDNDYYVPLGTVAQSFLTVDEFALAISPYGIANVFHAQS